MHSDPLKGNLLLIYCLSLLLVISFLMPLTISAIILIILICTLVHIKYFLHTILKLGQFLKWTVLKVGDNNTKAISNMRSCFFNGGFEQCFLFDLFLWWSSFEVTFLYLALKIFHSFGIFNVDLFCCCIICTFDCKMKF